MNSVVGLVIIASPALLVGWWLGDELSYRACRAIRRRVRKRQRRRAAMSL